MKKMTAVLMVLCLICTVAALAEESVFTLRNGVTFGMSMEEVIAAETVPHHEIDREHTRGPVSFTELEYENVTEGGVRADITYLFADGKLVALCVGYEARDIGYDAVKADLTAKYGGSAPLDLTTLGNGVYALDDDGRPEAQAEAWISGNVMIVLERDEDDIDVTCLDLSAPYIR